MTMDDSDKLAAWPKQPRRPGSGHSATQVTDDGEVVTIVRTRPPTMVSVPETAKRAEGAEGWHPEERELIFGRPAHNTPDETEDEGFALAMIDKLANAPSRHGVSPGGWMNTDPEELRLELLRHIAKGDPVDVANYAAFLWKRGLSTVSETTKVEIKQAAGPQDREPADEVRQANEKAAASELPPSRSGGDRATVCRICRSVQYVDNDGHCEKCGLGLLPPIAG